MPAGEVAWIQRTPFRRAPCVPEARATLRADWGVEGDRHARPASGRQVVIVAAEVLDDLGLAYGATREQLTIRGLGERRGGDVLRIGDVRIELVRSRVPCPVMDTVRPGLERELRGRGGWCGRVLAGGVIALGDEVVACRPPVDADPPWLREYVEAITAWEESPPRPVRADGWTFPQRLAHLVAWDERGAGRIAARAAGASGDPWGPEDIDAFNAAAVARLTAPDAPDDLWVLHDTWSTAVVDATRRHPAHAEAWVRALTAHYREHS